MFEERPYPDVIHFVPKDTPRKEGSITALCGASIDMTEDALAVYITSPTTFLNYDSSWRSTHCPDCVNHPDMALMALDLLNNK